MSATLFRHILTRPSRSLSTLSALTNFSHVKAVSADFGGSIALPHCWDVIQAERQLLQGQLNLDVPTWLLLRDMGVDKVQQMKIIAMDESLRPQYEAGAKKPTTTDIDAMAVQYSRVQRSIFEEHGIELFPGAVDLFQFAQRHQLEFIIQSAFDYEVLEPAVRLVEDEIEPDRLMTPQFATSKRGRPSGDMNRHIATSCGIEAHQLVVFGDTVKDAQAAHDAGCVFALLPTYSASTALAFGSPEEYEGMTEAQRKEIRQQPYFKRLRAELIELCQPQFVVDHLSRAEAAVFLAELALQSGKKPGEMERCVVVPKVEVLETGPIVACGS